MSKVLFGLDVEAIQDYIFCVPRMREIRGGSYLLDYVSGTLSKGLMAQFGKNCRCITSSGGITYALVDESAVCEFKTAFRKLYREQIPEVSVVMDTVPVPDGVNGLKQAFTHISRALARHKMGSDTTPIFPMAGAMQPCRLCGVHPATEAQKAPDESSEHVCSGCARRAAQKAQESPINLMEDELVENFQDRLDIAMNPSRTLEEMLVGWGRAEEKDLLNTQDRYVAMIVADINRLGSKLQDLTLPGSQVENQADALQKCSQEIEEAIRSALTEAAASVDSFVRSPPPGKRATLPLMPLLAGGDDLLVLCTAQGAIKLAGAIIQEFSEWASAISLLGDRGLSLSVGVAIAHHKFPQSSLYRVAKDLMRRAKAYSAELHRQTKREYGTLDFQRITSPMFGTLSEHRKGWEDGATAWSRRPYAVELKGEPLPDGVPSLKALMEAMDRLQYEEFPRKRLRRLEEFPRLSAPTRDRVLKEEVARMSPRVQGQWKELWQTILGCDLSNLCCGIRPGIPTHLTHESPLMDLVELEGLHD